MDDDLRWQATAYGDNMQPSCSSSLEGVISFARNILKTGKYQRIEIEDLLPGSGPVKDENHQGHIWQGVTDEHLAGSLRRSRLPE